MPHLRRYPAPTPTSYPYPYPYPGSWPRSGLNPKGEYEQEEVALHQPGAGGRSRLTYLVYLNDDFEGGA